MITITQLFRDVELMDSFITKYLNEFAPAGYSNEVTIKIRQTHQEWKDKKINYEVLITRSESCD
jgi:hypothetical protein